MSFLIAFFDDAYLPPFQSTPLTITLTSQAVLKEAMRLCPSTGLPLERLVPCGGVTVCNTFLPECTNISACASAMHGLKDVYGEDAGEFRPERWIEADERVLREMNRCYFAVSLVLKDLIHHEIYVDGFSSVREGVAAPGKVWL